MRISRFICALTISLLAILGLQAKEKEEKIPPAPVFCGVAVKADLAGPMMKLLDTRFNQLEVGLRLNFRDHFFPIGELGIGECNREGRTTDNMFSTRAPYFRVGMDYNMRKKHNGNRLFVGIRYGFSSYRFDMTSASFSDPVWGTTIGGLQFTDQHASMHWAEACVGCETKLWKFIRLGWTLGFKFRIKQKGNEYGDPYYVPGFGKNGSTVFGGTANLIFDFSKLTKKEKKDPL